MTNSNRLFGNISTIYMASAQSPIFCCCASYNYFPTAHLPIICLLQIEKLFHHGKSSKYLVTLLSNIVLHLQIAYLETFRRYTWLLLKVQFFGYCASYNYFSTANLPIICLLQIEQLFLHWKSSKYMFNLHRKIVWHLQIAYLETFRWFIWLLRKNNF